jgi:hypothetical protein
MALLEGGGAIILGPLQPAINIIIAKANCNDIFFIGNFI